MKFRLIYIYIYIYIIYIYIYIYISRGIVMLITIILSATDKSSNKILYHYDSVSHS